MTRRKKISQMTSYQITCEGKRQMLSLSAKKNLRIRDGVIEKKSERDGKQQQKSQMGRRLRLL